MQGAAAKGGGRNWSEEGKMAEFGVCIAEVG